jgi:hypothetical protein
MKRATFLKSFAAAPLAFTGTYLRKGYAPVGHMTTDSPGARDVDHVTVDGRRVERVFELDDVEGYVRYYGPNPEVEQGPRGERLRTYYEEGEVRVHWKRDGG